MRGIRKGDKVEVISGDDRGVRGTVHRFILKKGKKAKKKKKTVGKEKKEAGKKGKEKKSTGRKKSK